MEFYRFTYETYQDVRHNLFKYCLPLLIAAGFLSYFFVVPPTFRNTVDALFSSLPGQDWLKGASGVVVFGLVAFLMTEVLQVHHNWYDLYIVRWRYRYATDFILPRLVQPFGSLIGRRFHEVAERNIKAFQERLFYPYVADRDAKIEKNKLVRFYEAATVYWMTQLNEIVIMLMLLLAAICRVVGPKEAAYVGSLLNCSLVLVFLFAVNRVWVWRAREKVRGATADEIEAILTNHSEDLQQRVRKLCQDHDIPLAEVK